MRRAVPRPAFGHLHVVRNIDSGILLERFLVAAVSSLLILRFYLELTGFPQVGGNGLHIAHMLWGGLLMLISIVLVLSLLGTQVKQIVAILGGAGFGLFIDELGKFITSNNNYFFRPTFAIIYIIFIVLFIAFHIIDSRQIKSEQAYLVNALDLAKESILHDLDVTKKDRAMLLLQRCDAADPLVAGLRSLLEQIQPDPTATPSRFQVLASRGRRAYLGVIDSGWFEMAIVVFFCVYALLASIAFFLVVAGIGDLAARGLALSTAELGDLFSFAAAGALVVMGIVRMYGPRRSRLAAYLWFRRAVLVEIFVGQVFSFYTLQFAAVPVLGLNLIILGALDFMIHQERAPRQASAVRA